MAEYLPPPIDDDPQHRYSRLYEDAKRFYREQHDACAKHSDFLYKQAHYVDNASSTEKDRRRIQPKGMELRHLHRHKVAQLCRDEPYFECWPGDVVDDPPKAEDASHLLRHFLTNPKYRYRATERRVISDALGIAVGVMTVEWHPDIRRIVFRKLKSTRFYPAPGWVDIHDSTCPYVVEEADEPIAAVIARGKVPKEQGGWQNTENLWPDNCGTIANQDEAKTVATPRPDDLYGGQTVRTVRIHFRDSGETDTRAQEPRTLSPDQFYMGCPSCGMKMLDHPRMPDGSLPMMGEPCPYCAQENPSAGSYLQRIEREVPNDIVKRYPNGKLCIFAPIQKRLFYEGPWQAPMRTFPFMVVKGYEHPDEFIGQSDTALHWSHQTILNALRRLGYEQMQTSKPLLIVAGGPDGRGLLDYRGEPFLFSDAQGQVAYTDGQVVSQMVQQFQGNGLPNAFVSLYQIMQSAFQATQGIDDLGLTAQNSKDIAAATVTQLKQMGEIPVEDHRAMLNEAREPFFGAILDLAAHVMTDEEAVRVFGPDGIPMIRRLKGTDLPLGLDVVVTTSPSFRQASMEDFQKVQAFGQMDPALQVIAAGALNISPSLLRRYQAARASMAQAMPPGAPQAMDGGMAPPMQNGPPQPNGFAAPQAGGFPPTQ